MELYILSKEMEILSAITTYDELIWDRKVYSPGKFKLSVFFTQEMNQYLVKQNRIVKTDDKEPGIIESKILKVDKNGREYIVVSGNFASGLLKMRIAWEQFIINGNVENAMRTLVHDHCIAPENKKRVIPDLYLGNEAGLPTIINRQVEFDNIAELLAEIGGAVGYGWRVVADVAKKKLYFEVYKGVDRTSDAENRMIFSRDFGNVYTMNYNFDLSKYRNTCLIGGQEKEGQQRVFVTANDFNEGLDRYEMWYDGGGVRSDVEDADGNKVELTPTEYRELLLATAKERMQDYYISEAFEAKVRTDNGAVYKEDYDLGDYVTFRDKRWGIQLDTQITEIIETYSKKEKSVDIIFGDDVPSLIDLLKAQMKG